MKKKKIIYAKNMEVFLKGEFRVANVAGLHTFLFLTV